ncbi:M16 family metallopeptidase [Segetibacter aerophilus]|uniref:Zinc protease n=1 Tax=Segetibacter aerophilus TaxID=670293 RepID=A0A512B9K6_9BACT|nr:M16 family metallopeptidase [Segetibacter aerophilus]GEO08648.1 zinc protease [Segetibacter aerophilus]
MRFQPARVFVCFLLILQSLSINAQTAAPKKLGVSPNVKIGKLANGLTYYIRKNQEPKNRAELRLVVKAGSILETDQQVGLAHFTEHMAFNGTKNFKKQELVDFLEKSGVNFGADLNASTSYDETIYMLQLPTDSQMVFKKGFQILEDWAHNVTFENSEIDKERGVVVEEWRLGQGADERLRTKFYPVLLKGSRYATRNPIGTKANLDTFKYETVKQFYKDWYRPDLQAVVVVGDVNVAEVEQLIKQHFAGIRGPLNPKPRIKYGVPSQKETQTIILTDPEQAYNQVMMFYKQPSLREPQTDLEYRTSIVHGLFNSMMSSRLQELAQKPDAPFLFGGSSYGKLIGDKDALTLMAVAKDGKAIARSTETVLQENERVRQNGFTQSELERAKVAILSSMENSFNERNKTKSAELIEELIRNFLTNEPIPGIEKEYGMYKQFVPGIKLSEVNVLLTKWIKPTDRAIIVLAPEAEKDNLVSQAELLALVNKKQGTLKAYEDKVMKGSFLAKAPVAGKIVDEKEVNELGVTELTLSNGAKVILKPTDFKNDEILISAISKGGSSLYSDSDYLSASNATTIALYGGTGNYDVMSLQKALTGKQVSIAPSIGSYSEGISGSTTPKDLATAFQLIYGYFTQPRKDSSMFEVLKQQLSASLANKGKDPNSVFGDSVSYIMGNYHPRRKPLSLDRVGEIKLDKAFSVYQDRFADASDFIFTFVGNFKVDSLKPYIETYIASLPSTNRKETWRDVGVRFPTGVVNKVITKGKDPKSSVRLTFTGTTEYSDLEATQLDQVAKVLEIRLREILREDQGGVYGVGVGANINREPINSYSVTISFGCAPENVEKLSGLVLEEVKKMKADGGSQTNVEKVIAEDTRGMETGVKENNYWLYNLQSKYYRNEDPLTILQDPVMVRKLTVERTKELANKYFNFDNLTKIVLMPEGK